MKLGLNHDPLIILQRSLNAAEESVSGNRNAILIFLGTTELEVKTYKDATEALKALFELDNETPCVDIVLVRAATSEGVRLAFKNYSISL